LKNYEILNNFYCKDLHLTLLHILRYHRDCQIFFIRPSQLPLLSTINVNVHNSYCYPNLVQLHVKSHKSLLLVTKQAGNRICTLDVQIPPTEMLFGDHLFSYSLLSSLPYASCSHSSPQMFRLEPDLSFLDTVFSVSVDTFSLEGTCNAAGVGAEYRTHRAGSSLGDFIEVNQAFHPLVRFGSAGLVQKAEITILSICWSPGHTSPRALIESFILNLFIV
uniref:ZP domain-containing protein n=1 Tax=Heligmosomoides polygyrus TaxID=6339 RepID=A0A183GBD4_HELPZ